MWDKEFHGARDFGWRRQDGEAYVGQRPNKFWLLYGKLADGKFHVIEGGFANAQLAMDFYDGKLVLA